MLHRLPPSSLAEPNLFLSQGMQGGSEQGQRPLAIEDQIWGFPGSQVEGKAAFCGVFINGKELLMAATLERLVSMMLVDEVVTKRLEQVGAEPSLGRDHTRKIISLEPSRQETLDQVLGAMGIVTLPTSERVEWKPIDAAECLQRLGSLRVGWGSGGKH